MKLERTFLKQVKKLDAMILGAEESRLTTLDALEAVYNTKVKKLNRNSKANSMRRIKQT